MLRNLCREGVDTSVGLTVVVEGVGVVVVVVVALGLEVVVANEQFLSEQLCVGSRVGGWRVARRGGRLLLGELLHAV